MISQQEVSKLWQELIDIRFKVTSWRERGLGGDKLLKQIENDLNDALRTLSIIVYQ